MVRNHCAKLGFEALSVADDGETRWRFPAAVELGPDVVRVNWPAKSLEAVE
jgi:hypothetical protein